MTYYTILNLLQRVPHPPNEPLPGGASDAEIAAFEQETGIGIPAELRLWLRECNGPCVGPGGIYGINTARAHLDIRLFLSIRPAWQELQWLPIAGDGCGNHYVMPTRQEFGDGFPIVFVDTLVDPAKPRYIVASGLKHFLTFLLEKELAETGWPFDKDFVTARDPDISRFHGLSMPWGNVTRRQ